MTHDTRIGVDDGQGQEEGEAPDQEERPPAVGGSAQGPGLQRVDDHDIPKNNYFQLRQYGKVHSK